MEAPGEKLLIRLWETLAEKGIGGLLKPWQIRREGRAHLDVRREELLALASVERQVAAIRLTDQQPHIEPQWPQLEHAQSQAAAAGDTSGQSIPAGVLSHSMASAQADTLRRELNVAKAVHAAEDALLSESSTTDPAGDPSDDWMYRWRDYASAVSTADLQLMWGRVLAGEVKTPGKFSMRFLNFLHNLDQADAALIAEATPFFFGDYVPKIDALGGVLPFHKLLALQELGVLSGIEGNLRKNFQASDGKNLRVMLQSYEHGIGVSGEKENFHLSCYAVTTLGVQLRQLGNFDADVEFVYEVARHVKAKGLEVSVGTVRRLPDGMLTLVNAKQV
jgi:hypothetical protein